MADERSVSEKSVRVWLVSVAICAAACVGSEDPIGGPDGGGVQDGGVVQGGVILYVLCSGPAGKTTTGIMRLGSVGATKQCAPWPRDSHDRSLPPGPATWSSSNPAIATVDANGLVTAVGNGFATVFVASQGLTGNMLVMVDVRPDPLDPIAIIDNHPVCVGERMSLWAVPFDEFGNALACSPFSWSSADATVATITSDGTDGNVTCVKEGTSRITVRCGGQSGTATLTVARRKIEAVFVSGQHPILPGETVQLTAVAVGSDGQPVPASFTWSSDNPAVATVDQNGLVTATGYGGTSVWATAPETYFSSTRGSAAIQVGRVVSKVTVSPTSASIAVGSTVQFSAFAEAPDGGAIPDAEFGWDTLDERVATIDHHTGVATGIDGGGPITVLASVIGPASVLAGGQGSATLTVTSPPP